MNADRKMIKARTGLVLDQPFFGSLALRLDMVPDPSCATAWTDGSSLGYNPAWIDSLSLEATKGLIAHEVMHLAACHHLRRQERDHVTWNQAGDHAINHALKAAGITLCDDALCDPRFKDKCAEEIYSRLQGKNKTSPDGQTQNQLPGNNQKQKKQGREGGHSSTPSPGMVGEVRDAKGPDGAGLTEQEKRQAAADWKVAAAQAARQARAMGRMPGELLRLVEEAISPRLDWKDILRRFINQNARNDYSWSPPNRRFIHLGLYLPGLRSQEIDQVTIAVDTSGSIRQAQVNEFAAELSGILDDFPQTSITVIYCDAKVTEVENFTHQDLPLKLHPKGGGGTDFRPPFTWVEDHGVNPVCFVYLTDGECNRFPDPPSYPVLWVGTKAFNPPFGDFIQLF